LVSLAIFWYIIAIFGMLHRKESGNLDHKPGQSTNCLPFHFGSLGQRFSFSSLVSAAAARDEGGIIHKYLDFAIIFILLTSHTSEAGKRFKTALQTL
jgi:hypothetical protein